MGSVARIAIPFMRTRLGKRHCRFSHSAIPEKVNRMASQIEIRMPHRHRCAFWRDKLICAAKTTCVLKLNQPAHQAVRIIPILLAQVASQRFDV